MSLARRILWYYRTYGIRQTAVRLKTGVVQTAHLGRMVLFRCRLPVAPSQFDAQLQVLSFDCTTASDETLGLTLGRRNSACLRNKLRQRFSQGARLWIVQCDGSFAGFGWSIVGRTIEPHFFPLLPTDVHLFDFFISPDFRGRGINVMLVAHILHQLGASYLHHAHIECAAWNVSQLRSLQKTPFVRYAEVIKVSIFGRQLVLWLGGLTGATADPQFEGLRPNSAASVRRNTEILS